MRLLLSSLCVALACVWTAWAAQENRIDPSSIGESEYVRVDAKGHLKLRNERVRFWGVVGNFPSRSDHGNFDHYRANEAAVKRLKELGFNMVRFWNPRETGPCERGDGSVRDLADHFIWCCKNEGIRVWMAGLDRGPVLASDVDIVEDGGTRDDWMQAMKQGQEPAISKFASIWDQRLRALRLRHMKAAADHFNPWTGLRYADDPVIAVWELTNEQWWFYNVMHGRHLSGVPQFFLAGLYKQWNDWLRAKCGNQDLLRKAWAGNVLEWESLDSGNVALLPLSPDYRAEAQARSLGINIAASRSGQVSNESFNRLRGADVIEFLLKIWIEAKQAEANELKTWGRSTSLCPLVWDTGIGYDLPTQYMQQHADAIAHDSYMNGTMHPDPGHRRFPWFSALEELPKMCWDRPWLEQNRMPGKPFFVYENQIMQPAKYRGEHALRMASLGSIQDWDIVIFHYWGVPPDPDLPAPYERPMDYTYSERSHPQGYHFQYDDVQQSAISLAGEIFKNFLLSPAPSPTLFVFGRKSLYDPNMLAYGTAGDRFLATTYRYGMRLVIDPTRETDEIRGPSRRRSVYEGNPIEPTDAISYDWQKGHLLLDSPSAAAYTGFYAQYGGPIRFKNGVSLRGVRIHNDAGIAYTVKDDEKYLTFALASTDGKPLADSRKVRLTLMSTSFNSGFVIDESKVTGEWFWQKGSHPKGTGSLPILYARVEADIEVPMLDGMRYRLLDWHLRSIADGVVERGVLSIPGNSPVFIVELTR